MKGLDLIIKISLYTALLLGVLVAILNYRNSWSELHYTVYDPLLNLILLSIVTTFLSASATVKDRFEELTALYIFGERISYRLEHGLRWTALLFAGVLIFGVNNRAEILEITIRDLHFIFTGLAIVSGYITMLLYAESAKHRTISYILTGFGLVGFLMGFMLHLYSVSWAEVFASLPMALFIYYIAKK